MNATCQTILIAPPSTLVYTAPHRPRDDMSFRQTLSGFRKKVKGKLSKMGKRPERGSADAGSEGYDRSTLSSQSEPGIVVGGESRGDIKLSGGKDDPRPDDSRSVSRSAVGIGHDQGGSDDKASGGETSQKGLHPHPHVQTDSGSSREMKDVEGKRVDKAILPPQSDIENSAPIPSTSRVGEPEST